METPEAPKTPEKSLSDRISEGFQVVEHFINFKKGELYKSDLEFQENVDGADGCLLLAGMKLAKHDLVKADYNVGMAETFLQRASAKIEPNLSQGSTDRSQVNSQTTVQQ